MPYKFEEEDTLLCAAYDVFQVVIDVDKYPDFVPWCKAVYIKEKTDNVMMVDLLAVFNGIGGRYTSKVIFFPPSKDNIGCIKAESSNGVFEYLYNEWQFIPIDQSSTTIKFYVEFKFKFDSFSILLNRVYEYIQNKVIAAFKQRVEFVARQKLS